VTFLAGDELPASNLNDFAPGGDISMLSSKVIVWNGDTNIYRSAANTLKTDDALQVAGILTAANAKVGRPYLHAYQSSTQSIANTTDTAITMGAEILDTISGHSTVSNTSRYTPNVAGYYRCIGNVAWAGSTAGDRAAQFRLNGSAAATNAPYAPMPALNGAAFLGGSSGLAVATFQMNGTTDYIELWGSQNSGGSLSTNVTGTNSFMIIEWIAA